METPTTDTQSPSRVPAKAQDPLFVLSLLSGFVGLILLFLAAVVYGASSRAAGDDLKVFEYARWILAGGLFLFVLAVGLQLNNIVDLYKQKKSRIAANVVTMAALALALTGLVNYVGSRHYRQFDFTSDQLYSISDETKKVLETLDKDVEIYA